jgi:anti-sigma factor RsiW
VSIEHRHQGICLEIVDQLSDYIDGELEDSLCSELEAHLAECPDCRVMVDTMRKTIILYRTQSDRELPWDVRYRLYRALGLDE